MILRQLPRVVMLVSPDKAPSRRYWAGLMNVAGLVAQATDMAKQAYTAVVGESK